RTWKLIHQLTNLPTHQLSVLVCSPSKVEYESRGRHQVVDETEADAVVRHRLARRRQLANTQVERRLRDVIRDLESETDAGRAERHAKIRSDAEREREDGLRAKLIFGEHELAPVAADDERVRAAGLRRRDRDERQRRCDSLAEIVCDPAYPDEPIGPDLTSWFVFDKRDDAARVVQPRVDRHLHRCARLSRWCAERCAADLQRG